MNQTPGALVNARICLRISTWLRSRSSRSSSFEILGASELSPLCSSGESPLSNRSIDCRTEIAPSSERLCRISLAAASLEIATGCRTSMGPVSMPSSNLKTVTPKLSSPARIARCTGAAPRNLGSKEKWRLIQPRGTFSNASLRIRRPYAITTTRSGLAWSSALRISEGVLGFHISKTFVDRCSTNSFGEGVPWRPLGRSGVERIPTTSRSDLIFKA